MRSPCSSRTCARGLPPRLRDVLAIVVIGLSVVLSLNAFRSGMVDDGLTFLVESDRIVVTDVSPWGAAGRSTLQAGAVVLRLNQVRVNRTAPDHDQPVLDTGQWPWLLSEPVEYIEALPAEIYDDVVLSGEEPPNDAVRSFYLPRGSIEESWPGFAAGLALLGAIWWWFLGRREPLIRRLAAPAAAAISVPLLLPPFALTWGYGTLQLIAVIVPLAMLPLADGLAGMLGWPSASARSAATCACRSSTTSGWGRRWNGWSSASIRRRRDASRSSRTREADCQPRSSWPSSGLRRRHWPTPCDMGARRSRFASARAVTARRCRSTMPVRASAPVGSLEDADGCIRTASDQSFTVIWPPGYRLSLEGGEPVVHGGARDIGMGELIRMGGGYYEDGSPPPGARDVDDCSPPYFLSTGLTE